MRQANKLNHPHSNSLYMWVTVFCLFCYGCSPQSNKPEPEIIRLDPAQAATQAQEIRKQIAAGVADGLELTLWATDSLSPDPIALTMDHLGRAYITRTNRQKNSEFDIRGHRDWMTESISFQTVDDRRAFLKKVFAPENSEANNWLPDLNGDSLHDWRDLAVEKEEIWRIEDESGDGVADMAQLIVNDFHDEVTDVAGALLLHENEMFLGVGPDMWRMRDESGDGIVDWKESISHGYNVHIGFGGHGMSGLTVGPDGKIWWAIGDVAANVTDVDGNQYPYHNQGAIFRANPDGSDFEVYAAGLRNTHEFVFDEYGNLFSEDNDGDHPGESERLVYIVNGSDAGWRTNWQFGKYTDPDNNTYKVWMDEKMYLPRHEDQAAYIIPPIRNYHNGPTGMRYNPGTALGEAWYKKFFLVEFRGTPTRSNIYAFQLEPKGAGFEFAGEERVLNGVLATGIEFGPGGALYAADWIDGWNTKNYGRIWKLDVPGGEKSAIRQETKSLLQANLEQRSDDELGDLLHHADMRVRLKAQFALAKRGEKGAAIFEKAVEQKTHQLARVHGIWGTAQLARKEADYAKLLTGLFEDSDSEIRAQAARWLGDIRYEKAGPALIPLLKDESARVRFFAAEALGRIQHKPAISALITMLRENANEDLYLRHAGAIALARIGDASPLLELADNPDRSLRIAAVIALRRMQHEGVASFLNDQDEYIVTEAARAIHDDFSIPGALPQLARLLGTTSFRKEALLRRVLSANLRIGKTENLQRVAAYAGNTTAPEAMRAEAISILGVWAKPSVLDRVDGRNRGKVNRDPAAVRSAIRPVITLLLDSGSPVILAAAAETAGRLALDDQAETLLGLVKQNSNAEVRIAALTALGAFENTSAKQAVEKGMKDREKTVRAAALTLLPKIGMEPTRSAELLEGIVLSGTMEEQQSALDALANLPAAAGNPVLERMLDRLITGKLNPEIELDLVETIEEGSATALQQKLADYQETRPDTDVLASFRESLYGGDARKGRRIFRNHESAQCTRCHAVGGAGGGVGPDLANIGNQLSREELLAAMVAPSDRIATGYGAVTLTLKNDQTVSGVLIEESDTELVLKTSEAEPLHIQALQVVKRQDAPSSMPPMGVLLDKRELRDVLEYLTTLKTPQ